MARFNTPQSVGVPGTADTLTPELVNGTTATSLWTNSDALEGWLLANSGTGNTTMTAQDALIVVPRLSSAGSGTSALANSAASRNISLMDATRCNISLVNDSNTNFYNAELRGRWDFEDCSMVWRNNPTTSDTRIIWPGSGLPSGNDPANTACLLNINNMVFSAISEGTDDPNTWAFQMSNVSPLSVLDGMEFRGFIAVYGNGFTAFHRFSPAPCGADEAIDSTTGNDYAAFYGFNWRTAHQGGPLRNEDAMDSDEYTPPGYGLYTAPRIDRVVDGEIEYSSRAGISTKIKQFNHSIAEWWVNPNWGAHTGTNLHIGFHQSQTPGNGSGRRPSVLWLFQAHNPVFRDNVTLANVTTPTRIRYDNVPRLIPASYEYNNAPVHLHDNEVVVAGTSGQFSGLSGVDSTTSVTSNSGVWVQAERRYFDLDNGTHYGGSTDVVANRNPALANNTISEPGSQTFYVKNYRWDFPYTNTNALNSQTCPDTALLEFTEVNYDAQDLRPYLNNRLTETDALESDINDFADVYPSLRRFWAETFDQQEAFPVDATGTTFTFDRTVRFSTTLPTGIITTSMTLNMVDDSPVLTGDNTTFAFGTQNVAWLDGIVFPSGITISGGDHMDVVSLEGVTWTATDNPRIRTRETGARTFEEVFGNVTGNFTATAPAVGLTLTATPEQVAQLTLPAGSNINIQTLITVTGGAGEDGSRSHLQIFPLGMTGDVAAMNADDILAGAGGLTTTAYPFEVLGTTYPEVVSGARFVLVWTRPGYNEVRQIIGPLTAGNTVIEIVQTRNMLANLTVDPTPTYSIDAIYDETNNRVDYFLEQGGGNPSGAQTNWIFEQSKSDAGVGEFIAKNAATDVELITHNSNTATALRTGTYQLRRSAGAPNLQQNIAFVSEEDPAGGANDGLAVSVIETITATVDGSDENLATVLVGAEVQGVTYGEVDSIVTTNRTLQNTEIRTVVDEELDRGTLTNIGRP